MNSMEQEGRLSPHRRFSWIESFKRLARYRLIIPIKRSVHSPEHTARGVMIGVLWAMTPTVGIQMFMVLVTWIFSRNILKWDFSLINGLAWTWITSVPTVLPVYYVFFITGKLILGEFDDLTGYQSFTELWQFDSDSGLWASFLTWFDTFLAGWGVPMLIGCLPWSVLSGWIAYRLSLNFVIRYRERREPKRDRYRQTAKNSLVSALSSDRAEK